VKLSSGAAYRQGAATIDGRVGSVLLRGSRAFASALRLVDDGAGGHRVDAFELHELDLLDPMAPLDHASTGAHGWGWLLDVQDDRVLVTSRIGPGVDVYRKAAGAAPIFERYVRTGGAPSLTATRQGDRVYLATGQPGLKSIALK
jgi:hypothetical protein